MHSVLKAFVLPAVALALGIAAVPTAALAQSAIKASVNDQAITSRELQQRIKMMQLFRQKADQKAVLEELIDEQIALQFAERRKITVSDAQVEERFNDIAKQVKLPPAEFAKALRQQGVEPDTLKKFFRAQMIWGQIMRAKVRSLNVEASEADIRAELAREGITADAATIKEFRLQQIVFVVPQGSPPGLVPQRQREAEGFRQRFSGCDGSLALAKSLKGVVVLDIGRRDSTQFDGEMGEVLQRTPAGGTLPPNVTPRGVEIVAVCSVKNVQSTAGIRAAAEKKLTEEQSKDLEKTFKAELRETSKIVYN